MIEHPFCNDVQWKIGFGSGTNGGSVNVRSQPAIQSSRVDVLRSEERKIVEWCEDAARDTYWYPVRVHQEGGDMIRGWVHSLYATFTEITACQQPVIPDAGDPERFIDTPIPGYPTMLLNGAERQVMGNYFHWLALYIMNGPYEFIGGDEVDIDQLHAAIQQLDATIRLAKMLPPHEPSPPSEEDST